MTEREPQTEGLPGGWELRSQERLDGTWWWDLLLRDPEGNVRWIATSRSAGESYGRRIVAALNAEARQQGRTELGDLRSAVEIMATKVTPYGEREDGTTSAYIVGDSTWHRVLAVARGSTSDAARAAIVDHEARARGSVKRTPNPGMDAGAVLILAAACLLALAVWLR